MAKTKKVLSSESVEKEFKPDLSGLESQMESFYLKTLPKLPQNIVDLLVQFAPWLAILSVVFGLRGVYTIFMINRWAEQIYAMAGVGNLYASKIGGLFLLGQVILSALSIQGLFAKKLTAWRLMYYAVWVGIAQNLINGDIFSLVLTGLISFYVLYQVKKEYK